MDLSDLPPSFSFRKRYIVAILLLFAAGLSFAIYGEQEDTPPANEIAISAFPITIPTMGWGFALDTLQVQEMLIQNGQSLSDLLISEGIDNAARLQLIENAGEVFDLTSMRAGKPWIRLSADSTQAASFLVYEPSAYSYITFDLKDAQRVWETKRPVTNEISTAAGIIEGSLWNAMVDRGYSYDLTAKMEDALQWSVDFHHLQKDDEFRLVYEQQFIEGEPVAVGNVIAAQYQSGDSLSYSIYFDNGETKETGYYNLDGSPMNAGFLRAPVKYARISSYFNPSRLHPILRYRRPHFGTDYAAPYGTPIIAVGNGVVTKAERRGGNGNYVKIRHDDTFESQYLHMQKFAQGIRPGVSIRQGQVIGYVGSTGLATGPHVCFRFWKDGKQVNHLKLKFPPADPLSDSLMQKFIEVRDQYLPQLAEIQPTKLVKDTLEVTFEECMDSTEVVQEISAVVGPLQEGKP